MIKLILLSALLSCMIGCSESKTTMPENPVEMPKNGPVMDNSVKPNAAK
jgi:hypothetical protein